MTRSALALFTLIIVALCSGCPDGPGKFMLGAEARLEFSPTSLVFGDVPRNEVAYRVLRIRHSGTGGTIFLDPINLITSSPDLSIGTIERTALQPGEESRIQIIYNSNNDEPDSGDLYIGHNLATGNHTIIPVSTPGQRANLVATPSVVDFGIVQEGDPKKVAVDIRNVGSAPATLTGYTVSEDDKDKDFGAEFTEGTVVESDGLVTVYMTYQPTGKDSDSASVYIATDREDVKLTIDVEGQEETPVLVAEPSTVQFGWVTPNSPKLVEIDIRNEGNADLELMNMTLVDAMPALKLANVPALPITLIPGDSIKFGAVFSPEDTVPMSVDPLGTLVIESNDEARNPYDLDMFGAAGIPSIIVVPEDVVDFGYVAEDFTALRTVTVLNVGDQAVNVTDVNLDDKTTEEFFLPDDNDIPKKLNPGEAVDIKVHFENAGGTKGTEFARFFITTDDPLVPEYALDVVARRAEKPTCEPSFVPELLSLGATSEDGKLTGVLKAVNFGSGNCTYTEYELDGCLKVQSGVRHQFDCQIQGLNTPFKVIESPPLGTTLGPGQYLEYKVEFTAPTVQNIELGRDFYYSRLALLMSDPNTNGFKYVAPPGGWLKGINIQATSAIPKVYVNPPALDYGLVRTDCQSGANLVTVMNVGPVPATVTGLEGVDCPAGVNVVDPQFPTEIPGFSSVYFETYFAPEDEGDMQCALKVSTNAAIANWDNAFEAVIPAKATGTDVTHQIDVFEQIPAAKVDVLFVVDDSWSMADEQVLLKEELPKLVEIASEWGQDYHIAVTTTDTKGVRGEFVGNPKIGTKDDSVSNIANNLVVGVTGYFEEMGLESAWLALSGVNMSQTDIACLNVPGQCPKYDDNNFYWCKSGYCTGPNWGFLREDADLVIIIVSDEEDSSPQSVPWYVSQFSALKGKNSGYGVNLHAIITTQDGCAGGFGTVGYRYELAVQAFNGHLTSICASDFSTEFKEIGEKTFGLKERFYPSLPIDPTTLVVRVDGKVCDSGWEFNIPTQSVVFDEEGSCFPDYGETIELEYDVPCVKPADDE
jgi:hypothetical protein